MKLGKILLIFTVLALVLPACAASKPQPSVVVPPTTQQSATVQPSQPVQIPAGLNPIADSPKDIKDTGGKIEYLDPVPMSKLITAQKAAVTTTKPVKVPVITWGGDVATIHANGGRTTQPNSIFAKEGLSIELFREDNFLTAVEKVIKGETPYLRGTMDMVNSALEVLQDKGIEMVVIYQMTWSTGGDTIVVRSDQVKNPSDLRGKQIGIQRYGPHMLYLATVLKDSGLNLSDIKFKWLRELSIPSYDSKGVAVDPMTAMQKDSNLAAVTVISPDMVALTSGGNIGTGAESSVKGAKLLLSTKTAGQIICDIYAVRKDYFDTNRKDVQSFVHGLMSAGESTVDLFSNHTSRQSEYQNLLKISADILRDSPQATADIEGLLQDCTFVGFKGNVQFFTGEGTLRSFDALTKEAQEALTAFGFMTKKMVLSQAKWDYNILAQGLRDAAGVIVTAPKFDPAKVERFAQNPTAKQGVLFEFELYFEPNQKDFSAELYRSYFDRVLDLASKYPGAIVLVEGHADPSKYLQILQEKSDASTQVRLDQTKQAAKNLSVQRSNMVRDSLIGFTKTKGLTLDTSQFTVLGAGIDRPKFSNPATEQEWRQNMRVVFQIIQAEAELENFTPSKGGK